MNKSTVVNGLMILNNVFDEKVTSLIKKEEEEKINSDEYQVNLKYANAYIKLVQEIIPTMNKRGVSQNIKVGTNISNTIGNCIDDNDSLHLHKHGCSNAIISNEGLDIVLVFLETYERNMYREEGYNEDLLNEILKEANISVKTELAGSSIKTGMIYISYRREKKLEDNVCEERVSPSEKAKRLGL